MITVTLVYQEHVSRQPVALSIPIVKTARHVYQEPANKPPQTALQTMIAVALRLVHLAPALRHAPLTQTAVLTRLVMPLAFALLELNALSMTTVEPMRLANQGHASHQLALAALQIPTAPTETSAHLELASHQVAVALLMLTA